MDTASEKQSEIQKIIMDLMLADDEPRSDVNVCTVEICKEAMVEEPSDLWTTHQTRNHYTSANKSHYGIPNDSPPQTPDKVGGASEEFFTDPNCTLRNLTPVKIENTCSVMPIEEELRQMNIASPSSASLHTTDAVFSDCSQTLSTPPQTPDKTCGNEDFFPDPNCTLHDLTLVNHVNNEHCCPVTHNQQEFNLSSPSLDRHPHANNTAFSDCPQNLSSCSSTYTQNNFDQASFSFTPSNHSEGDINLPCDSLRNSSGHCVDDEALSTCTRALFQSPETLPDYRCDSSNYFDDVLSYLSRMDPSEIKNTLLQVINQPESQSAFSSTTGAIPHRIPTIIEPPISPPGTPKKRCRKGLKLWHLMLVMLEKPNKTFGTHRRKLHQVIRWIDRKRGLFEIVDPDEFSSVWGQMKNSPKMKYDHVKRSIRNYYGQKIMNKVGRKTHRYQFEENADMWVDVLNGAPAVLQGKPKPYPSTIIPGAYCH